MTKNIRIISGKPSIVKRIEGKDIYFGRYESVEDAIKIKKQLEKHNWDKSVFEKLYLNYRNSLIKNTKRYIYKNNCGNFQIRKRINGKMCFFGVFKSEDVAINERNFLIDCNWDLDKYLEMIDLC